MSGYPMHDKLTAVKNQSQAIGEFLEWLQDDKNIHLATGEDAWVTNFTRLLAEYFDIDETVLEAEKRAMLAAAHNESSE